MDTYEIDARARGYRAVAGIDEAGRGPLAGPVVAAAVIFGKLPVGRGIDDSKKLSPGRRAALAREICAVALSVGVGLSSPAEIDEINIHRASLLAMERAVAAMSISPDFLLVDGKFPIGGRFPIGARIPQSPIVSGDSLSVTIAAASIIAKTARDGFMESYEMLYPGYGLARNKGYPTKAHFASLASLGPTPIHRRSFRGVLPACRP